MFDIEHELLSKGLSKERYLELIDVCQKKAEGLVDLDWSEISEQFNLGWTGDSLRRMCRTSLLGACFVKQFFEENRNSSDSPVAQDSAYEDKKRELEQLKVQYRDERNAWQKQNRDAARMSANLDLLAERLNEIGKESFKDYPMVGWPNDEKEAIVLLSDLHIGKCFSNCVGEYNSELAGQRLFEYFRKIKYELETNDISTIHIVSLGDQINGNIHKSLAITNRENVIEQVKTASVLIAEFISNFTKLGYRVSFYSVNGNHSRISKKDEELRDERLDNLVCWIVAQMLSDIPGFKYMESANLENGLAAFDVLGKKYLAVHGDLDSTNEKNVANLCFMTSSFPEAVFRGHYHTPASSMVNGVQIIQSGSLDGAGDEYTMGKRINGSANQTFVIVTQEGIESIHNVKVR